MMMKMSKSAGMPARAARKSVVLKASASDAKAWIGAWEEKKKAVANRPVWWPGKTDLPNYGGPGDFGFDPLRLSADADKRAWYVQAELVHARFAMLGAAGVLFPELLKGAGLGGPAAATPWYEAGAYQYSIGSAKSLFAVQMLLFAFVEFRRLQDIRKPGSAGQDPFFANNKLPPGEVGYPGGIFDPLGYSRSGDLAALKQKEIKNGRLAMMACLGFAAQAYTTGTTPLANLSAHLASPWDTTVFSNDLARVFSK